jgi:hypothetical protein
MMIGLNTYWRSVHAVAVCGPGTSAKLVCGLETVKPLLLGAGIPGVALLFETSPPAHARTRLCQENPVRSGGGLTSCLPATITFFGPAKAP